MTQELEQLADSMMRAIEQCDVEAMQAFNHDDVRIWHSFDGKIQGKQENISLLGGMKMLGQASYNILERICIGDRIIQRHELSIRTWDGSRTFVLPAAIFMTVRDGKVMNVEEYADSRDVGIIIAAMQEAAAKLQSAPQPA